MKKIIKFELIPEKVLLERLKQTRLRGYDKYKIYKNANLTLEKHVDPNTLIPTQRFVLNDIVNRVLDLSVMFLKEGVDIFDLNGAVMFWLDDMDPGKDPPIPFLPPIVEESHEKDGRVVNLINDGIHRVYAAKKINRKINVVLARNVPTEYPYYAYPLPDGWNDVTAFDELPEVYLRKTYRNPDNFTELFRDFNDIFPGVQEQRKKSNPIHIKE